MRIRLRTAEGDACIGSGRVIARGLVLTARHVLRHLDSLDETTRLSVRSSQGSFKVTEAVAIGNLDAVALLAPDLEGPPGKTVAGRLRTNGPLERCSVIGYPEAGRIDGRLTPEYLQATVLPRLESGFRLALAVRTPSPIDPIAWQGLSGAGVTAPDGRLLGIVTHVPLQWQGRLHAVAIDRIIEAATESRVPRLAELAVADIDDEDRLIRTPEHRAPGVADHSLLELLHYRNHVVPFIDKGNLAGTLEGSLAWARSGEDEPDVSVMILTGPAGAGKSRLAAEVCDRLAHENRWWRTGFVDYTELATAQLPTVPLLAVCDYAERHPDLVGSFIERAHRGHRAGELQAPVRFILASRAVGDWLERVRDQAPGLDRLVGNHVDLQISEFGPYERRIHAERAYAAFCKQLGRQAALPPDLLRFDRPLTVHIAALMVAQGEVLHAPDDLEDPQEALLRQLMRRESRRWTEYRDAAGGPVVTNLNRALEILCVSTLTVPLKRHLPQLLRAVPSFADATAERLIDIADAFHELYPLDRGRSDRIAPVEPDLVAAHLLATTPERSTIVKALVDSPVLHRWPAYHARLTHALFLAADNYPAVEDDLKDHLATSLAALTGAAERTALAELIESNLPHLVEAAVARAVESGELTGARHLEYALDLVRIDSTVAENAMALLAEDSVPRFNASLAGLGAALAGAATRYWRPRVTDPMDEDLAAKLAAAEDELGNWQDLRGRFDEALLAKRRAVQLYESLAGDEEYYIPHLAGAVHNYALAESAQVDEVEAVGELRRAIGLWRYAHEHLPGDHRPDLALAGANLGRFLIKTGRPEEALGSTRSSVRIWEELCGDEPGQHRPMLRQAVYVEATCLVELGRNAEAVDVALRSVDLAEELARFDRSEHLPDLAVSVSLLAVCLEEAGRPHESLAQWRRHSRLWQEAHERQRGAFGVEFMCAAIDLARFFARGGRLRTALEESDRAIAIGERLMRSDRSEYTEALTTALGAAVDIRLDLNADLTNGLYLVDRLEGLLDELSKSGRRSFGNELAATRSARREFHRRLTRSSQESAFGGTPLRAPNR